MWGWTGSPVGLMVEDMSFQCGWLLEQQPCRTLCPILLGCRLQAMAMFIFSHKQLDQETAMEE